MRREITPYGEHERQFGEWFLPDAADAPLVVLIHGGYFRPVYRLDIEEPNAVDLCQRGYAVWNLEYRTYEFPWPTTMTDVAAGIARAFADAPGLGVDVERSALFGHSAGGCLAAWATSQGGPGFDLIVLHAPVACLASASRAGLGAGAVDTLMGGRPEDVPERYAACDPAVLVPDARGVRVLLHGDADDDVPLAQSEEYLAHLAAHGREASLVVLPGEGHYEILDPASAVAQRRRDLLARVLR